MTTDELLTFLKELGIKFSVWRLNKLVKRGVLKEPPKIHSLSRYSPRCWPLDTVNRVKLAIMLDRARERRQKITC